MGFNSGFKGLITDYTGPLWITSSLVLRYSCF